jgi:hypothetical protein
LSGKRKVEVRSKHKIIMMEVYEVEDQDTDPQTFHVPSSGDQEE